MAGKFQSVKGMHDVLPDKTPCWEFVENKLVEILKRYAYQEIRLPAVEKTDVFRRSIGESTDIVSKEMYTFIDQGEDSLTLRPEGTAGCVRACIEHSLFQQNVLKLWYSGPMFRREQPQKGRTRQFHQIGVEVFGLEGPDIDAEIIIMLARMWEELGLEDLVLQINTLGTTTARQKYRTTLMEYFSDNKNQLDEDSLRRLETNPLRILDSKNPAMKGVIDSAPVMNEYMDDESLKHFSELQSLLSDANIDFEVNPKLVRGLDYYNKTVFEWITDKLGAQGTICAGGRYDGLVELFGGKSIPGIGFGAGLERLIELIQDSKTVNLHQNPDIYFIIAGDNAVPPGFILSEKIRDELPVKLLTNCGGGSFKSQFKRADKSGAKIALVLGDSEIDNKTIGIKRLREDKPQLDVSWDELVPELKKELGL